MTSKHLTYDEIDALIFDAETERRVAEVQGARHWASTADYMLKTLCRFQRHPHIESEATC